MQVSNPSYLNKKYGCCISSIVLRTTFTLTSHSAFNKFPLHIDHKTYSFVCTCMLPFVIVPQNKRHSVPVISRNRERTHANHQNKQLPAAGRSRPRITGLPHPFREINSYCCCTPFTGVAGLVRGWIVWVWLFVLEISVSVVRSNKICYYKW